MASIPTTSPSPILRLPPKIHVEIAEYLPDSDINSLIQTGRYFCSILNASLWSLHQRNDNNPPNAIARYAPDIMGYASGKGNVHTLEKLFRVTNVNANARSSAGENALCIAEKQGHCAVVLFLLLQRAHLPTGLSPNERPLLHAVRHYWNLMVRVLLSAIPGPIDLHDALNVMASPLYRRGSLSDAIIREFAKKFPPISLYQPYFRGQAGRMVVRIGYVPLMRAYIARGGPVNVFDTRGNSLLHTAVMQGNVDMVELLLQRGARADFRNLERKTALDEAIDRGNWEIARMLPGGEMTFQFYSEVGFI